MANRTAILAVRIVSDAANAPQGFDQTADASGRMEQRLDRASVAAAGIVAGLAVVATEAFNSASRLEQAGGAVESVFGAQADAVKGLAAEAAQSVGLATSEYSELASVLGSQLGNLGVAQADLVPTTDALIQQGADLAATFGGTTSEAVEALSSLMRGERDPIERYGVSINQARIDGELAAAGLGDLEGEARKAAETQAVLALVTEQTAAAQGAFGREADTAAGQQQRANAEFENAKAALGEALLPIVSAVAAKFSELATFVANNSTAFVIIAAVIGGFAVAVLAVNAAISAYRAITAIATAGQWLLNAAMSANPIGLIIIGVAALVAGFVLLYNKSETFRNLIGTIGSFFSGVWSGIVGWVQNLWDKIGGLQGVFRTFQSVATTVFNAIMAPIRTVVGLIDSVRNGISRVGDFVGGLFGASAEDQAGGPAAGARRGGGQGGGGGLYGAAPGVRAAAGLSASGAAGVGAQGALGGVDARTYITVNGAVDPGSVADQLGALLDKRDAQLGRRPAVQVST